jgi:putative heme-binding domain-containing protein
MGVETGSDLSRTPGTIETSRGRRSVVAEAACAGYDVRFDTIAPILTTRPSRDPHSPSIMPRTLALVALTCLLGTQLIPAQSPAPPAAGEENSARRNRTRRPAEVGPPIGANKATPIDRIKALPGFEVELLYSVPGVEQGSWVNIALDDKQRILVSDQYGGLYRFTAPPLGEPLDPASIEKVPADIRAVNGMVWAFGALYVGVNDYENKISSGLYRLTDSDGDDRLDKVELLRALEARGDHGVHAVLPTPDGKALYLVCGNGTKPTAMAPTSPVPAIWGEDHLLPRMPDGRGFMRDVLGPGGIIYRVSPDGQTFEAVANGFRNIFDAAINSDGELFTYDADMEYDFNTSWYRPTRINHVVSGAEFGWRNGAGKRPEFYPDNLPATLNIGPGSPTGVTFGYGAKFPAKYQRALYALDWSWGKLYAVHLEPHGSTYTGTKEEFVIGAPLPITDAIIHPRDGAMYFTIGGRRVQSGLYRVTYVGDDSTEPIPSTASTNLARATRRKLEAFHGKQDPRAIAAAWPVAGWSDQALTESDPGQQVEALLALARAAGVCPQHRKPETPPVDEALRGRLLDALLALDWQQLNHEQRLTLVRTIEIALNRFGRPDDARVAKLIDKLDPRFPAPSRELNWLLCETLVFLQSPHVAAKALDLIAKAPTQEEQIEYARSLRTLTTGWTPELRTAYFEWLLRAANYRGGASFEKFIEFIRTDAIATLSEEERRSLAELLAKTPERKSPLEVLGQAFAGRTPTIWTLEELSAAAQSSLRRRDFDTGRRMFASSACFACHRFGNEGGMTGPDLTSAGRRYSPHDLLDQIINPSKVINEQFSAVKVLTESGQVHTGVVVNLSGDNFTLNTDLTDPNQRVSIDRKEVELLELSPVSPMPVGLLNLLTKDEVLDLVAYVVSGGDPAHEVFRK